MGRDDFVRAVTYTHDGGLQIEVQSKIQQVLIPPAQHTASAWLGPFDPFDVSETCAAIEQFAREQRRPDLFQASYDWYWLNSSELPEGRDGEPKREPRHHFKW
jgi:hypothetical protein